MVLWKKPSIDCSQDSIGKTILTQWCIWVLISWYYGVKKDVTCSKTEKNQIRMNVIFFKLYATFTLGQQKSILWNRQTAPYFLWFINSLIICLKQKWIVKWDKDDITVNSQGNLSNDFTFLQRMKISKIPRSPARLLDPRKVGAVEGAVCASLSSCLPCWGV